MALLQALVGQSPGRIFDLSEQNSLGRHPKCDVVLDSPAVSRRHAQVVRSQKGWLLQDLGSRNGTFLNDKRIERAYLSPGDQINICGLVFRFEDPGASVQACPDAGSQVTVDKTPLKKGSAPVTASSVFAWDDLVVPAERLVEAFRKLSVAVCYAYRLEDSLKKVLDCIFEVMPNARRGAVLLAEQAGGDPQPKACRERERDVAHVVVNSEMVQQALREREPNLRRLDPPGSGTKPHVWVCTPIISQYSTDTPLGVLHMEFSERFKAFEATDSKLLVDIAEQVAACIHNVRLHEAMVLQDRMVRDLAIAEQVQRQFLPTHAPMMPGYEAFVAYRPAYCVSGDYYDFIPLSGSRLAVAIGDVCGKGIPAALCMARLFGEVRSRILTTQSPGPAMEQVNEWYRTVMLEDQLVTLVLTVLDWEAHQFTVANAGHPRPRLYRAATSQIESLGESEAVVPLGAIEDMVCQEATCTLMPGDGFSLLTDGLHEARNTKEQLLGWPPIHKAIADAHGAASAVGLLLVHTFESHIARQHHIDDMTLICVSRTAPASHVPDAVTSSRPPRRPTE